MYGRLHVYKLFRKFLTLFCLQSKLNCEVLYDDLAFEVRWAVAGDSIVVQLVCKLEDGEYMSFGLSGDDASNKMIGGDVVVAWIDSNSTKGHAVDYFLDDKSQCAGTRGSCPDERLRKGTNSVDPLNAAMVHGYSIVTFQRPLAAQDELDRTIFTNGSQAVIWAIGPLNPRQEVSYHSIASKKDILFDFGRMPKWNCPLPEAEPSHKTSTPTRQSSPTLRTKQEDYVEEDDEDDADVDTGNYRQVSSPPATDSPRRSTRPPATPAPAPTAGAWDIPAIQCHEPEDGVFYAQMGPTGGRHGYPAITGHVGWGIAWYINGLLIPEINVVRGKTYTFVVEGGVDPEVPARYHPFYITDDPVGGYEHKTAEERQEVRVLAGVRQTRRGAVPTGTGRLCNWTPDPKQPPADEFASFGAYQRTLTLECDEGEPGVVQWTPDDNTPDVVYYQCFTHRYLGWKINVLDSCDYTEAASEIVSSHVSPEDDLYVEDEAGELQSRPSIRITTRVKPNGIFLDTKDHSSTPKNLEDSHMKGFSQPTLSQSNSPQNFYVSESTKPVKDNSNVEGQLYDSHINDPFIPPLPFQQSEPKKSSDNTSHTTYHLPQVTEPNQESNDFLKQKYDKVYKTTSQSHRTSPVSAQYTQLNHTISAVDPMRKPIVHATTPFSVLPSSHGSLNLDTSTEQKLDVDKVQLEESQQSVVTVNNNGIGSRNVTNKSKPIKSTQSNPMPASNSMFSGPHLTHSPTPQNIGITRIPAPVPIHPQMPYQRPAHIYNKPPFRRPMPPRGYPRPLPSASMYRPQYAPPNAPGFTNNPKKPFYRMPVVMASSHRPIMVTPPFTHRPHGPHYGPFQQSHMSTVKYFQYSLPNTHVLNGNEMAPALIPTTESAEISSSTSTSTPLLDMSVSKAAASTSENQTSSISPVLLSSISTQHHDDAQAIPVAINTGFHPESVVVEGGFKPIVTKKVIAEDRSSLVEKEAASEKVEAAEELSVIQEERKENPFEGQQPETFEPMFIPSPPDRIMAGQNISEKLSKKPPTLAEDLVPPAPGIDHRHSPHPVRKVSHPHVIRHKFDVVRRPLHTHKVVTHYHMPTRSSSPSFRYQQSSQQDDETAMAAERMDIYYLPPDDFTTNDRQQSPPSVDEDLPPGAVVTYDGKPVIDSSLASSIPDHSIVSSKQQLTGTAALLQGTPQFGPYLGEVPPPVPEDVHPENIPQLQNQRLSNLNPVDDSRPTYSQRTRLASVTQLEEGEENADLLLPEATEVKEVKIHPDEQRPQIDNTQEYFKNTSSSKDFSGTVTTDTSTNSEVSNDDSSSEANNVQNGTIRIRRLASPHHSSEHEEDELAHEHRNHGHHHDHIDSLDQSTNYELQSGQHKLMTTSLHRSNGALNSYSIPSVIVMALFANTVLKFLDGVTQSM